MIFAISWNCSRSLAVTSSTSPSKVNGRSVSAVCPCPWRSALAAFGMTDTLAPDLFLIALAALELLASAATHQPLLLISEDAQWLDRSTADVLAFVARRLEAEPIVLVIAVREWLESPLLNAGLTELRLERLDDTSSRALLHAQTLDLTSAVRERLLHDAAGNPLALIELPIALRSEQHSGELLLPSVLPLTARLEQAYM